MAHKTDDLSPAQKNFISRRIAGGDALTEARVKDYVAGHDRALASRLKVGSPRYFQTITEHLDGPQKSAAPLHYDGAARTMPQKPRSSGDQFQALRNKASSGGRYGKK